MTENEAIRDLQYLIEEYSAYPPETGVSATVGSLQYCITALKEIQQYRKIGTVEECREAVEKQKPKKPPIVTNALLSGSTSYVCPNCGIEMMSIDRNRIQWGHMQKYCQCCGQAIQWDEDLEETEDEL